MMAKQTGKHIRNGLFIAAVSASAALLFAPKSGEETRRELLAELKRYHGKAQELADNLRSDIEEAIDEVNQEAQYQKVSLIDVIKRKNAEMTDELADLQKAAYTTDGEFTAVDKVSGDITDQPAAGANDTTEVKQDTVVTEDGEVAQVDRPSGNVTDSQYDAAGNHVVPADSLDDALKDNDL